jgi:hypothetical protein
MHRLGGEVTLVNRKTRLRDHSFFPADVGFIMRRIVHNPHLKRVIDHEGRVDEDYCKQSEFVPAENIRRGRFITPS